MARDAKRRLPVLQAPAGAGDEAPRPPWQWVGFGALAIFTAWIPASAIAGAAAARLAVHAAGHGRGGAALGLAIAGAYAAALAAGAIVGGYVVGRWGDPRAGTREAALAGLLAAAVAIGASWLSFGLAPATIAVAVLAAPAAALGGKLGLRRRARAG